MARVFWLQCIADDIFTSITLFCSFKIKITRTINLKCSLYPGQLTMSEILILEYELQKGKNFRSVKNLS